jgi:prophage antirepressor-like protein
MTERENDNMIEHAFEHPEFGTLRVYESPDGSVSFNLEDVARVLGLTPEEAAELAGPENVGSAAPVSTIEDVRAFDAMIEAL